MKIVIEIPEEEYQNYLKMRPSYPEGVFCYIKAIQNGTPLPKGHGRLIDADVLKHELIDKEWITDYDGDGLEDIVNEAPTIIEKE